MLSTRHYSTDVDRKTWLCPPSGTYGPPSVTLTKEFKCKKRLLLIYKINTYNMDFTRVCSNLKYKYISVDIALDSQFTKGYIILTERHCDQQSNNLFSKQWYILVIDNIWYIVLTIIVSY